MRLLVLPVVLLLLAALPASAQTTESALISMLGSQGFVLTERRKTWLGRIVLEFVSETLERQIIFDPTHGTVLRDFWEAPHADEENKGFWSHWFRFAKKDNDEGHE